VGTFLDLLIHSGRVIDPMTGVDSVLDIGVRHGRISSLEQSINARAKLRIDASGLLVTPGLIDLHTHVYPWATYWGVDADTIGRQGGTTTVLDAGSTGSQNYRGFQKWIVSQAKVRVLGLMNLSELGLTSDKGELRDPVFADIAGGLEGMATFPQTFLGCKIRLSGELAGWGQQGRSHALQALEMAGRAGTFLMVHIGNTPFPIEELLSMLRPGDIVTHCYRPGPNNLFDDANKPLPAVQKAQSKGIFFDVGHGSGSFQYERARSAVESGFLADTISTDLHIRNINGPVYNLPTTMAKMLDLGMTLDEVFSRVTTHPAKILGLDHSIGSLQLGREADIAILRHSEQPTSFTDSMGTSWTGSHQLKAIHTFRAGEPL